MDIELENEVGKLKQVPQGLSWTGFFFNGFAMMARGLIAKGFVCLAFFCVVQALVLAARAAIFPGDWRKAMAVAIGYGLAAFTPSLLCLFRLNQWTLNHWLKRGYMPVSSMWGISDPPEEWSAPPVVRKPEPWFTLRSVAGVAVALFVFVKLVSALYTGNREVLDIVRAEPIMGGWTRQAVLESICRDTQWHEFRSKDGVRRVEFTGLMGEKRVRLRFAVAAPERQSEVQWAQIGSELIANDQFPAVETNWAHGLSSRLGSEWASERSTRYPVP
jgi:hypothetical protein